MKRTRRIAVTTIAVGVLVAGAPLFGSSVALAANDPLPPDYLVPWDGDIPVELSTEPLEEQYQTSGNPDNEVAQLLVQVELENPHLGIAGTEWDPSQELIRLYATASKSDVVSVLTKYGLSESVEPAEAKFSATEMSAEIDKLIGEDGRLPSGEPVVSALPALDGSRITLTLDEAVASRRSTPSIPSVGPEVEIVYGAAAVPGLRNHAPGHTPTTNYRYSGAYMHPSTGGCTTGYRGVRLSDSAAAMLSAEHCSVNTGTGAQWYYSSLTEHPIGQAQGQILGAGYRPDLASWTGAGVAPMVPGIFIGNNQVPGSTVHAVKGVAGASVGSRVCYSGSFTGTICGNIVSNTNATACYGAPYGCYDHLVVTTHEYGTPAAGQGDSGGPAYISTGAGVQAAGFISGILNASPNCTGDGGRQCSASVLYAPIVDAIAGGYGINYIP